MFFNILLYYESRYKSANILSCGKGARDSPYQDSEDTKLDLTPQNPVYCALQRAFLNILHRTLNLWHPLLAYLNSLTINYVLS